MTGINRTLSDREIEARFRGYDANVEALKLRREELRGDLMRSSSDYSALERLGCQITGGKDRVPDAQRYLEAEERDEIIRGIMRELAPVEGVFRVLDRKRMGVVRRFIVLRYREERTMAECAEMLKVAPRTIDRIRAHLLNVARPMFRGL